MQKGEVKNKLVKLGLWEENGPVLQGRKIKYKRKDGTLEDRKFTIKDLLLCVNPKEGSTMEKDLTCDSKFLMLCIHEIGESISDTYSFLLQEQEIYLFMDNTSGQWQDRGKKNIKEY